jgi:hypothetical protein
MTAIFALCNIFSVFVLGGYTAYRVIRWVHR